MSLDSPASCVYVRGVRSSSVVECLLMVRWVIGLILHGGLIELFLVPASAPRWCNNGCGMCYPAYGMVNIKDPLLLIEKE